MDNEILDVVVDINKTINNIMVDKYGDTFINYLSASYNDGDTYVYYIGKLVYPSDTMLYSNDNIRYNIMSGMLQILSGIKQCRKILKGYKKSDIPVAVEPFFDKIDNAFIIAVEEDYEYPLLEIVYSYDDIDECLLSNIKYGNCIFDSHDTTEIYNSLYRMMTETKPIYKYINGYISAINESNTDIEED